MAGKKKVHIIGGGTFNYVRNHLALAAPAFGHTARELYKKAVMQFDDLDVELHLTRMAGGGYEAPVTNEDLAKLIRTLVDDLSTKIIFLPAAVCDFGLSVLDEPGGKFAERLTTGDYRLSERKNTKLLPATKIIPSIRARRKDIFLVGFKQTCGDDEETLYQKGLGLCKQASCNLVLANDVKTRLNMIVTPEEARYHVSNDRDNVLYNIVEMAKLRSHLTFTRSTVIDGQSVDWESPLVPEALRKVVDHCIAHNAYKPFRGATVGHFACKLDDKTFLTSKRKTNFNDLSENGLVKIKTDGPDTVLAYGAKPSVGGQSQRIVFEDHPEYDCIVHFHCPLKSGSKVPSASQREYECGSHECGQNTSTNLGKFGNLGAVFLEEHGPNIVFHHSINPQEVIDFIEDNFNLSGKTGGYVS